jgi:thiol-disulfide isomerase/thioredoxin
MKIVWIILLGLAHFLICALAGALGWDWQVVIVPVISIVTMIFASRVMHFSPTVSLLFITPFFLVYTIGVICRSDVPYATYPIWIVGLIASASAFFFLKYKVSMIRALIILGLLVFVGRVFVWTNSFAYGNINHHPEKFDLSTTKLVYKDNSPVNLDDLKGKVVLFDIWHSGCYWCIEAFPELQRLYDDFKGDSSVKIISLNFPISRDKGIKPARFSNDYSFEKMYFLNQQEYEKVVGEPVPITMIMDKSFKCRYAGSLNTDWNIFIGNAKRIIKRLKDE